MLISSFDKTIHTCKIVRIVLVDISNKYLKTDLNEANSRLLSAEYGI